MAGCNLWRSLGGAALLLVLAVACGAEEPATNRLAQLQEQVVEAQTLLAGSTNDAERAHWQERLTLLAQDRKNIEQRLALEAKERSLNERQLRQADARLREMLRVISTDVNAPSNELSRIDSGLRQLKAQRSELEKKRRDLATPSAATAEQAADLDQQLRVADEEIGARVLDREVAEARAHLVNEASRIDEALRSVDLNPAVTLLFAVPCGVSPIEPDMLTPSNSFVRPSTPARRPRRWWTRPSPCTAGSTRAGCATTKRTRTGSGR